MEVQLRTGCAQLRGIRRRRDGVKIALRKRNRGSFESKERRGRVAISRNGLDDDDDDDDRKGVVKMPSPKNKDIREA